VGTPVYYLGWHLEPEHGPASDLFHKSHVIDQLEEDGKPPEEFPQDRFEELYDEVVVLKDDYTEEDLEDIYKGFQATGFSEWDEFLEARYCESCDSYIEGSDEALTHAVQNHGYDPDEEFGEPEYVHGIRSMSVGDVVQLDDVYHQVRGIGFEPIQIGGESQ
jgi:hypothetical protein